MRVIFLVLLVLSGWGYAADGDEFNLLEQLSEDDALMFAKAICEVEQECRYGEDEVPWGPIFVQFSKGYFWPYEVIYGKFTQGQLPEAFVRLLESTEGEPAWKGTLFRYQNRKWNYIAFGDPPLEHCKKLFGTANKESLICFLDSGTHITDLYDYDSSEGSGFYIHTFNFQGNTVEKIELISFGNTFSVFCDQRAKFLPAPYYELLEFSQTNVNTDGYVDLELKISETQFDTKHCYDRETGLLQQANNTILHKLIWLFDGETFTPTPETQAFLDNLDSQ